MTELINRDNLKIAFSYHPPKKEKIERIKSIRHSLQKAAKIVMDNAPEDAAETKEALNCLQYAHLLTRASIENNGREEFVPENEQYKMESE